MFRPEERLVFEFWDGEKERKIDPLAVQESILADESLTFRADMALLQTPVGTDDTLGQQMERDQIAAARRIRDSFRKAMGIEPYTEDGGNERGLTDAETDALFEVFDRFLADAKKKHAVWRTSLGLSDSLQADGSVMPSTSA